MTGLWPQPHEGVTGVDREDALLSLDPAMVPLRTVLAATADHLYRACLTGTPSPRVARMYERITSPQPGDLVIEDSARYRSSRQAGALARGLGVLVTKRREWAVTDEEWEKDAAEYGYDERSTDIVWYVQYGPAAVDVCRWTNCDFMAIPWPGEAFDLFLDSRPVTSWPQEVA